MMYHRNNYEKRLSIDDKKFYHSSLNQFEPVSYIIILMIQTKLFLVSS